MQLSCRFSFEADGLISSISSYTAGDLIAGRGVTLGPDSDAATCDRLSCDARLGWDGAYECESYRRDTPLRCACGGLFDQLKLRHGSTWRTLISILSSRRRSRTETTVADGGSGGGDDRVDDDDDALDSNATAVATRRRRLRRRRLAADDDGGAALSYDYDDDALGSAAWASNASTDDDQGEEEAAAAAAAWDESGESGMLEAGVCYDYASTYATYYVTNQAATVSTIAVNKLLKVVCESVRVA